MATMASSGGGSVQSSREARRRRILERGSDRLALVTGRIQSLPSDADQSRPAASPPDQAPANDSVQPEDNTTSRSLRELNRRDVSDETVEPLLPKGDSWGTIASRVVNLLGFDKELSEGGAYASRAAALLGIEKELSQASSFVQGERPAHQREMPDHQREPQMKHRPFTTSQISSAIAASENDRMCCSIAAAILVILLHLAFPIPGWQILKKAILFRPLFLLILTNVSLVLWRLILRKPGVESKKRQMSSSEFTFGGNGLAQLGKALEVGLLLQNIFKALFMDVSIYLVVLISGLSLIRFFG